MKQLISLQIVRFVAAALVVWCHVADSTVRLGRPSAGAGILHLNNIGAVGVDLFFVLSGIVIFLSVRRDETTETKSHAWDFLRKRLIRVIPIYWIVSLPLILIDLFFGRIGLHGLFVTLTFWPALPGGVFMPYLSVGWTLCFEMLFYMALFCVLLWKNSAFFILSIFVFCMILNTQMQFSVSQFLGNPIIFEFLFGVGIAFFILRHTFSPLSGLVAMSAGIIALCATAVWGYGGISRAQDILSAHLSWERLLLWGIPSALIVFGSISLERYCRGSQVAAKLAIFGDASYSIYLVHRPLISLFETTGNLWSSLPMAAYAVTLIALSIIIGLCVYLVIERPLLGLLRRLTVRLISAPPLTVNTP